MSEIQPSRLVRIGNGIRELGIEKSTLRLRLKRGLSVEEALIPVRKHNA